MSPAGNDSIVVVAQSLGSMEKEQKEEKEL